MWLLWMKYQPSAVVRTLRNVEAVAKERRCSSLGTLKRQQFYRCTAARGSIR